MESHKLSFFKSTLHIAQDLIHIALLLGTSAPSDDGQVPSRRAGSLGLTPRLKSSIVASQTPIAPYIALDSRITVLEATEMLVDCQRVVELSSQACWANMLPVISISRLKCIGSESERLS
jgi:hypothetical protein